jgi:ABC-type antimicrobial peptide transport system permease subunit
MYFIDNTKLGLINQSLNNKYNHGNDMVISITDNFPLNPQIGENLLTTINSNLDNFNFKYINHSETQFISGYENFQAEVNYISTEDSQNLKRLNPVAIYELTPVLKKEIEIVQSYNDNNNSNSDQFVNISQNGLEMYLLEFISNSQPNYEIDQETLLINNNISIFEGTGFPNSKSIQYSFNITGYNFINLNYYFYSNYNPNSIQQRNFDLYTKIPYLRHLLYGYYNSYSSNKLILFSSDISKVTKIIQESHTTDENDNRINSIYKFHFGFDYTKIELSNIDEFVSNHNYFQQKLITQFLSQNYRLISIETGILSTFNFIQYSTSSISALFFVLIIPMIIISFFFTHYSFNLIHKNILRNICIYKTRGASSWIIFSFEVFDSFILIVLSIIASILVGGPISFLSLKTDNLLSFNLSNPELFVIRFQSFVDLLVITAVILMIFVNANRVRKISKTSIAETENPFDKGEPYWKRHYVDVFLFLFGAIMLMILYFLIHDATISKILFPVYGIINLLLIPSPFAFVIGLVLILSRTIPLFLRYIGSFLWEFSGGLTAYSFKNVNRYKNATIRAILINSFIVTILILFFAQPYSLVENYKQNIFFQTGSEGLVFFDDNKIDELMVQKISNDFSQDIDSLSSFIFLESPSEYFELQKFLLVNTSSYLSSAYLKFNLGLKNSINDDFQRLKINYSQSLLDPINVIIDQSALKARNADIGSNLTLSFNNSIQRFSVIDSFVNWPYVKQFSYNFNNEFIAIGDINYYLINLQHSINNSIFNRVIQSGLFINFKESANKTQIILEMEKTFPLKFSLVPELNIKAYSNSFEYLSLTGQINLVTIISISIVILVLLLFINLQITERKYEIYTERALGMKLNQISYLFYLENIIITSFSLIIGNFVGILLNFIIANLTSNPYQNYPEYIIVIPFYLVFQMDVIILLISLIVSFFPSIFVLRQDISLSFGEGI